MKLLTSPVVKDLRLLCTAESAAGSAPALGERGPESGANSSRPDAGTRAGEPEETGWASVLTGPTRHTAGRPHTPSLERERE